MPWFSFSSSKEASRPLQQPTDLAEAAERIRKESIEDAFIKARGLKLTEDMIRRAANAAGPFWAGADEQRKSS